MTKMSDIKNKDAHQLSTFIAEKREELRQGRFAVAGSKARDGKKLRESKKDIARALTAFYEGNPSSPRLRWTGKATKKQ